MNKATLKKFKTLLTDKRDEILKKAKQTLEQDMALDTDDLPDEMDLASSEYLQSFTFRLRGREKSFLDKIEKALKRSTTGPSASAKSAARRSRSSASRPARRRRSASAARRTRSGWRRTIRREPLRRGKRFPRRRSRVARGPEPPLRLASGPFAWGTRSPRGRGAPARASDTPARARDGSLPRGNGFPRGEALLRARETVLFREGTRSLEAEALLRAGGTHR